MRGLSLDEVGHLSARLFRGEALDDKALLIEVQEEKGQILCKESSLEFYPPQRSLEEIGGLDNLKEWVRRRAKLFSETSHHDGLPLPSGCCSWGFPAAARAWRPKRLPRPGGCRWCGWT